MRVIGGEARGRRLQALPGREIRPTGDRVREALFNILGADVPRGRFLDLFAGTGSVGIEALSRGAAAATFVESRSRHAALIRRNLEHCGLADRARVLEVDVPSLLRRSTAAPDRHSLVFLDPPYEAAGARLQALLALPACALLEPGCRIVAESPARAAVPEVPGLRLERVARYGGAALCFYRLEAPPDPGQGIRGAETP